MIMAIIKVAQELVQNEEFFNVILESFDTFEDLGWDYYKNVRALRVQHEEVPKEDIQITVEFMHLYGVKPFVISYNA